MKKIPTAEKYLLGTTTDNDISKGLIKPTSCTRIMIELAKLHVEAAIKECIECAPTSSTDPIHHSDVVECLKDCYSLDNIK